MLSRANQIELEPLEDKEIDSFWFNKFVFNIPDLKNGNDKVKINEDFWEVHLFDDDTLYFYLKKELLIYRFKFIKNSYNEGYAELGKKEENKFFFNVICSYKIKITEESKEKKKFNYNGNKYYQAPEDPITVKDVLEKLEIGQYLDKLKDEGIEAIEDLLLLTENDLITMGFKIVHKNKLLKRISELNK
jgi:hypothetical protein